MRREKDLLGNIAPNKFKNEIKESYNELADNVLGKAANPDNKKSQDKALQWGAAEWCESALGPNANEVYGKNLDRQAFAVCMKSLKTDLNYFYYLPRESTSSPINISIQTHIHFFYRVS